MSMMIKTYLNVFDHNRSTAHQDNYGREVYSSWISYEISSPLSFLINSFTLYLERIKNRFDPNISLTNPNNAFSFT